MTRYSNIYIIILAAILLTLIAGYFIVDSERDYRDSLNIVNNIETINKLDNELNKNILESSSFLYGSYDQIINIFDKLQKYTDELLRSLQNKEDRHIKSIHIIKIYKKLLNHRNKDIYNFIKYDSIIKKNIIYISVFILKYNNEFSNINNTKYHEILTNIVSSLLLIINNLNLDVLNSLKEYINFLKRYKPNSKLERLSIYKIINHLEIFIKYYPYYINTIKKIINGQSLNILKELKNVYQKENEFIFKKFILLTILFAFGLITAIGFIIFYIMRLRKAASIDYLTGLYNRNRLIYELRYNKYHVLFIVGIEDFKHINNFYGVKIGDEFLKLFAKRLKKLVSSCCRGKIYRLGSDDFGILLRKQYVNDPETLANYIINNMENNGFRIQQWDIPISIAIGISLEEPFLEKADLTLKYVKQNPRLKYAVYTEEIMKIEKNIENNMKILKVLKSALESNRIVPYYQPILDNKIGKVVKYESLVRAFNEKGEMLLPGEFLEVAKKGKLYGEITKCVIEKTFEYFKENPCEFSVNLSVDDIVDVSIRLFIIDKLRKNPELSKRVMFEILESEGIENFDIVSKFIKDIKQYGATIAIDDFGTGYSNFSYLLQLDVDFIKIDGSLIKDIHINKNSEIIVKTIVNFAKKLNIKTVAEFVHNYEVHRKVIELGIDYSQGYFLGKPSPTCDLSS